MMLHCQTRTHTTPRSHTEQGRSRRPSSRLSLGHRSEGALSRAQVLLAPDACELVCFLKSFEAPLRTPQGVCCAVCVLRRVFECVWACYTQPLQ